MKINVVGGAMSKEEQNIYAGYLQSKYAGYDITDLTITMDGEYVNLDFHYDSIPFERIRRITGYLVGDLSRWNNGKRAEEADRVKHG